MSIEAMDTPAQPMVSDTFVRLGGVAGLLLVATALSLNFVLVAPSPAFDAPVREIAAYVGDQAAMLATSNTLRYVVYLFLPFFGVGLYRLVTAQSEGAHTAWAMVGLLGIIWIAPVGTVANSIEAAGIWRAESAAENTQFLLVIWSIGGALFIAAQLAWGMLILGFSVAGRMTRAMPWWLTALGFLTAASCFVGALGIQSVMSGGWAQIPWFSSIPLFSLWVLLSSVLMIRRG